MKNTLTYKDFVGSVHYSAEDSVFYGKIEGINDLITFEGTSVNELKEAFTQMVDKHLKDCDAEGITPQKSYKGSFNVRLSPELHRSAAIKAKMQGHSLNKFVSEAIKKAVSS